MITCTNCREEKVNEDKQTFIYRNWEGIKSDACLKPICDKCIEAGWHETEGEIRRLYIGSDRLYQEPEEEHYWPSREDILGEEE